MMIPLSLAFVILGEITASDWAGYAALLTIIAKVIADMVTRWQDRLDRESAAAIILSELEAQERRVNIEAKQREGRIVAKINENTEVSKEAFNTANGFNKKIADAVSTVAEATKAISKDVTTTASTTAIDRSTVAIDKNSDVLEEVVVALEDQNKSNQ